MMRFPKLSDIRDGQRAYRRTGHDAIQHAPPKLPAAHPAGVERLREEIAANTQRQDAARGELAQLDVDYAAAALRWDVGGELDAREAMNRASEQRRALQAELGELVEDAGRLQGRLAAAQAAYRRAEHDDDLLKLAALADAYAPILVDYKAAAVRLVALADDLHRRRGELRSLRNRIGQYADANGLDKPARDVSGETAIPLFSDTWLQGAGGSLAAVRAAMGLADDTE